MRRAGSRRGQQLVPRVEDGVPAVVLADAALRQDASTGLDTRDLTPTEPHQQERLRTVEELRLESRYRLVRRVTHRPQPADDLDRPAALHVRHAGTGEVLDVLLQLDGVEAGR